MPLEDILVLPVPSSSNSIKLNSTNSNKTEAITIQTTWQ